MRWMLRAGKAGTALPALSREKGLGGDLGSHRGFPVFFCGLMSLEASLNVIKGRDNKKKKENGKSLFFWREKSWKKNKRELWINGREEKQLEWGGLGSSGPARSLSAFPNRVPKKTRTRDLTGIDGKT